MTRRKESDKLTRTNPLSKDFPKEHLDFIDRGFKEAEQEGRMAGTLAIKRGFCVNRLLSSFF